MAPDATADAADAAVDAVSDVIEETSANAGPNLFALVGEEVVLDGSASTGALSYEWNFGNGEGAAEPGSDPVARVTYAEAGRFQAVLIAAAATGAYADALRGRSDLKRLVQLEEAPALAARLRDAAAGSEIVLEGALGAATPDSGALQPHCFDLFVFVIYLHALNDPIATLAQARLLLKPDGLLLA
ncbi:MAG: PKD domain-containing protein, partial [Myxococcota bacterium]